MLDEDLMKHLMQFIKEHPDSLKFDTFREETNVHVNSTGRGDWGRNEFYVTLRYDKDGNILDMNGIEFKFDTSELKAAIKAAICSNFKLKRKKDKILGKGNN